MIVNTWLVFGVLSVTCADGIQKDRGCRNLHFWPIFPETSAVHWIVQKKRHRKRGKRGGVLVRLSQECTASVRVPHRTTPFLAVRGSSLRYVFPEHPESTFCRTLRATFRGGGGNFHNLRVLELVPLQRLLIIIPSSPSTVNHLKMALINVRSISNLQ